MLSDASAMSCRGIRGTYDKHEYREEKQRAFQALASLLERITDPRAYVTPLRGFAGAD